MVIKARKKKGLREDVKVESVEDVAIQAAERSTKIYESNSDRITERPTEKFENDRVSEAEDLKEKIEKNEHTEEDVHKLNYTASVIMSALTLNNMAKALDSAGYSNREIRKILEENYRRSEEAYVQARMQGKSEDEAREAARKVQAKYLATIHASLDKEHQKDFEKATGYMMGQQEIGALALETGKEEAIEDAFNAKDSDTQKTVVKKHGLMKDFAIDAFFSSVSAVFTVAGALGATEDLGEANSPAEAGMETLDFFLQEEQRAQDETQNLASMNEAIEELIEADREKGESSEGGEPMVADLSGETRETLEKCGVSTEATVKEAIKIMDNARESAQKDFERVEKLSTPEHFTRDEDGRLVLKDDEREGMLYNKIPEFTPKKDALGLLEAYANLIEEAPREFSLLAAHEFGGKMGTAEKVSGKYHFSEDSPESVVLSALKDPSDGEAQQEAVKVLENPANVGVRAALLEAYVRAMEVLRERKEE